MSIKSRLDRIEKSFGDGDAFREGVRKGDKWMFLHYGFLGVGPESPYPPGHHQETGEPAPEGHQKLAELMGLPRRVAVMIFGGHFDGRPGIRRRHRRTQERSSVSTARKTNRLSWPDAVKYALERGFNKAEMKEFDRIMAGTYGKNKPRQKRVAWATTRRTTRCVHRQRGDAMKPLRELCRGPMLGLWAIARTITKPTSLEALPYGIDIERTRLWSCRCGVRSLSADTLAETWQAGAREPVTLPIRHVSRMICSCGAIARVEPVQGCNDHVLVSCPTLACGKSLVSVHEKVRGWVD